MPRKRTPPRDPYRDRYSNDYGNDYGPRSGYDDYGDYGGPTGSGGGSAQSSNKKSSGSGGGPLSGINYTTLAILGGVFILGIGVGIGFSSSASVDPQNVASREFIDRAAPNPELCVQYGASAIAMDARLFVTFSPFSVYVAQPRMQPGCVMRSNNWSVLQQKGVVTSDQVRDCKNRMNTFAFTGSVESSPKIDCVYQNDSAGNLFLNQPGVVPTQESERF